ncbi:MAG: hypothetical protein WED07_15180 [Candidatus Freyarchaeum deiterrae]
MASDLIIVRFKALTDKERLLALLSRDNPGILSDSTDGDLVVWSHTPIMISKETVQISFDKDEDNEEVWTTFEPEIVRAEAVKRNEEAMWIR